VTERRAPGNVTVPPFGQRADGDGDGAEDGAAAVSVAQDGGAEGGVVGERSRRPIDEWMYELMGRLAHDLRTPLGAIRMWSHVLRNGKESDRVAALDAIDASVRAPSETISFLADVSRAVVGRLPIERRTCDLGSIVEEAIDVAVREVRGRQVVIDLEIAARKDGALVLVGDPGRLREAVATLVVAAAAFAPRDGKVAVDLARVGGKVAAAQLVVRVPQVGLGRQEVQDLFNPYQPSQADLSEPRPHFGLGAVFARCLVRLHGGEVDGDTEEPDGTLVLTARLPLGEAADPPSR
jgi:signal transduction histidine kinase